MKEETKLNIGILNEKLEIVNHLMAFSTKGSMLEKEVNTSLKVEINSLVKDIISNSQAIREIPLFETTNQTLVTKSTPVPQKPETPVINLQERVAEKEKAKVTEESKKVVTDPVLLQKKVIGDFLIANYDEEEIPTDEVIEQFITAGGKEEDFETMLVTTADELIKLNTQGKGVSAKDAKEFSNTILSIVDVFTYHPEEETDESLAVTEGTNKEGELESGVMENSIQEQNQPDASIKQQSSVEDVIGSPDLTPIQTKEPTKVVDTAQASKDISTDEALKKLEDIPDENNDEKAEIEALLTIPEVVKIIADATKIPNAERINVPQADRVQIKKIVLDSAEGKGCKYFKDKIANGGLEKNISKAIGKAVSRIFKQCIIEEKAATIDKPAPVIPVVNQPIVAPIVNTPVTPVTKTVVQPTNIPQATKTVSPEEIQAETEEEFITESEINTVYADSNLNTVKTFCVVKAKEQGSKLNETHINQLLQLVKDYATKYPKYNSFVTGNDAPTHVYNLVRNTLLKELKIDISTIIKK